MASDPRGAQKQLIPWHIILKNWLFLYHKERVEELDTFFSPTCNPSYKNAFRNSKALPLDSFRLRMQLASSLEIASLRDKNDFHWLALESSSQAHFSIRLPPSI